LQGVLITIALALLAEVLGIVLGLVLALLNSRTSAKNPRTRKDA
jgi:ABC-type amino acid transport system permease subunit